MSRLWKHVLHFGVLSALINGCGFDDSKSSPPPVVGKGGDVHSIEPGRYFMSDLRNLQDGCGKKPLAAEDPITAKEFFVKNDGNANVSLSVCAYNDDGMTGQVRDNNGTLAVSHANRRDRNREYNQTCRMDIRLTKDNVFEGNYVESQTNRNEAQRKATADVAECTTSFVVTMHKG